MVKIFGREPAAWVGLIEGVLALVLAFGGFGLTQETVGIIVACVTAAFGVYTAYVTNETLLGPVIGLVKAALVLATVYGLHLTTEQSAAIIAVITMGLGFWQRTQVTPLDAPTFGYIKPDDTGAVGPQPPQQKVVAR